MPMTNQTATKDEILGTIPAPSVDSAGYQVILVSRDDIAQPTPSESCLLGAVAPRYIRERDEPIFQKAWHRVALTQMQGETEKVPPAPVGGIRLRGTRTRTALSETGP
jgi:hypothetical protein